MTKEEILHLGKLARIRLSDKEAEKLNGEIESILSYVSAVNDIVSSSDTTKQVGSVYNVFREDIVQTETGATADELVGAFPEKVGRFLKVKKIISND